MAILQSCCCWRSVRTGSYASAAYTTLYFSVTAITMAMFLYEESYVVPEEPSDSVSAVATKNTDATSRNGKGNAAVKSPSMSGGVRSFLEPEGVSDVTLGFGVAVLACATAGIFVSLLLIYGLYTDRRALLVPWVFTVLTTSLVDLGHTIYLLLLDTMQFNPMTAILFTIDFFLLSLNVYSMLCVVSQYQEYKAGRGTAFHQHEVTSVRYEVQPTATSCLNSNARRPVSFLTPMGPLLEVRPSPNASPSAPLAPALQENGVHPMSMHHHARAVGMRSAAKHVQFPDCKI